MNKNLNKTLRVISRKLPLPPVHFGELSHIHTIGKFSAFELITLSMSGHSLIAYPNIGVWIRSHDFVEYVLRRLDEDTAVIYSIRGVDFTKPYFKADGNTVFDKLISLEQTLPKRKFVDQPRIVAIEEGLNLLNWPMHTRHVGIIPPPAKKEEHVTLDRNITAASFLKNYEKGVRVFTYKNHIIMRFVNDLLFIYFGDENICINGKYLVVKAEPFMKRFRKKRHRSLIARAMEVIKYLTNDEFVEPPTWLSRYDASYYINVNEVLNIK